MALWLRGFKCWRELSHDSDFAWILLGASLVEEFGLIHLGCFVIDANVSLQIIEIPIDFLDHDTIC